MAFTLWHPDAVSGSHPPHLLLGVWQKWHFSTLTSVFDLEQKSEIKIVRISEAGTSLESGVRSSNLFGRATTPFKPLGGITSVNWVDTAYVSW
jgi:hypothetical protein